MNPETQMYEHERRRFDPWPKPRSVRLPPLYIAVPWPRCREPDAPMPPLRVAIEERMQSNG